MVHTFSLQDRRDKTWPNGIRWQSKKHAASFTLHTCISTQNYGDQVVRHLMYNQSRWDSFEWFMIDLFIL